MVPGGAPGMGRVAEDRADPAGGVIELTVGSAEHQRLAGTRRHQTQQGTQRRRLAGAVRPEQAGNRSLADREAHVPDGVVGPVSLGQAVDVDDGGDESLPRMVRSGRLYGNLPPPPTRPRV